MISSNSPLLSLKPLGMIPSCVKPSDLYSASAAVLLATTALNCKIPKPSSLAFLIQSVTTALPTPFPRAEELTA